MSSAADQAPIIAPPPARRGCGRALAWFSTPQGRLLWLSPLTCQLLTGARPPAEFLQPQTLFVALLVYGCGTLAVREIAWRWSRPEPRTFWPRLLWLAAACGVLVDGVMLASYTSIDWSRLGRLADTNHGHIFGLNLTWALVALAHHVALAVAVPVAIVELRDPPARERAWLSDRGLRRCYRLFWVVVVLGALTQEQHGARPAYIFVMLVAWLLHRRAKNYTLPPERQPSRWRAWLLPRRAWRPEQPLVLGFLLPLWLVFVVWAAPQDPPDGLKFHRVLFIFGFNLVLLILFIRRFALRLRLGWSERHTLAAVAGPLLAYALLAPWQALDTYHGEYPGGMGLIGLVTVFSLWRLRRTVQRRARAAEADHLTQAFGFGPLTR